MGNGRPSSRAVRKQRHRIWKKQKKLCYWCEKPTVLPEALLRRYLPMDDIYEEGMVEYINDLINQLKAKEERFRVVWETQLATVDHLVEHAVGGSHDDSNIVIACLPCNEARGRDFHESLDQRRFGA